MTAAVVKLLGVQLWETGQTVDAIVPVCPGRLMDDDGAVAGAPDGSAVVVDARGMVLAPGLHDPHVHFRDPGQLAKETMVTGSAAAAAGGYTTVLIMPNTVPALDGAAVAPSDTADIEAMHGRWSSLDYLENYEADNGVQLPVRYALCAAASTGRDGAQASRYVDWQHGLQGFGFRHPVIALSDDGAAVPADILDEVAANCLKAGVPFIDHCEHHESGVMTEGETSRRLGLPGIPASTETAIIERDIDLARRTGCHVHLQHVSCAASFDLIRAAKAEGLPVTCETAPHYIALNDTAVERLGTMAKMNPPLRSEEDRQATLRAIADGTVDMIATDHAPHTAEEKALGMLKAPNGIIGLETAYGVCRTVLVEGGWIDDDRLIELMSVAPARLLGSAEPSVDSLLAPLADEAGERVHDAPAGPGSAGADAAVADGADADDGREPLHARRDLLDLAAVAHTGVTTSDFLSADDTATPLDFTLLDPHAEWTVDPEGFHSKARNTPFAGMELTGRPMATVIGSRIVFTRIPASRIIDGAATTDGSLPDAIAHSVVAHSRDDGAAA